VLFIKHGQCLYKTHETKAKTTRAVIEIETVADRAAIAQLFADSDAQIQFNGGYYTISSDALSVQEMMQRITEQALPVSYFRDITHSTKRFF
jgi:ABC-2 type transport system ATP-binding protein